MTLGPGTRLGPYELRGLIGAGAMGEVYRARDPRLARDVAIKTLPNDFAHDAERLRRFEQEARAAGALQHPNIVTVFDVGADGNTRYVVQELLDGRTLRDHLAAGPISPPRVAELAAQVAGGLAEAHDKGIVHRDLKPENLFICSDGRIKILDFGLARISRPESGLQGSDSLIGTLSETGMVLGSVGYMAPEQVRGEAADARSDLFALGAIAYEMLAGRRAFPGTTPIESLNAILNLDPEPLPPAVPAPLARLIARCLEKDRARRFQSARDLEFALEALSESREAPGTAADTVGVSAARPHRGLNRSALLAIAAAFAFAIGAFVIWRLAPARRPLVTAMHSLTFSDDLDPSASPDGRIIAFTSPRDGTRRIWLKDVANGGEVPRTTGPDLQPRFSPDGSSLLYTHLGPGLPQLQRIAVLGGESRVVLDGASDGDWSPDGGSIVFISGASTRTDEEQLMVARSDGTGSHPLYSARGFLGSPRWSPDGRYIAVVSTSLQNSPWSIVVIDMRGHAHSIVPPGGGGQLSSPCWTQDGKAIVFAEGEGLASGQRGGGSKVFLVPIDGGQLRQLAEFTFTAAVLDRLPDGQLVAANNVVRENLCEMTLTPQGLGSPRWLTSGSASDRQPTYSPDGRWVMFSSNRSGNIALWEISPQSGEMRRVTEDSADDWDPAYSPDGQRILWSSDRTGTFEIWTAARDGSAARQVSHDSLDAENPSETRDGWVFYASSNPGKTGLWRVHPDGSDAVRLVSDAFMQIPDLSPDGHWVAYASGQFGRSASIRVIPASGGEPTSFQIPLRMIVDTRFPFARCRWMPDSRMLAYVAFDEHGKPALLAQNFAESTDSRANRRLLADSREGIPESFGVSPDGRHMVVAWMQNESGLMISDPIPELARLRTIRRPGGSRADH